MDMEVIDQEFSLCQVEEYSEVNWDSPYIFLGQTDEEKSLVCPSRDVPAHTIRRDDGWRALRLKGVFDFSLVGILSKIAAVLAERRISIFAVSTYNTDYVLVKKEQYEEALAALAAAGYHVIR